MWKVKYTLQCENNYVDTSLQSLESVSFVAMIKFPLQFYHFTKVNVRGKKVHVMVIKT